MSEDEIKAWFFKYGQYANGRDMALIKAIEAAIKPQRAWVGLTDEEIKQMGLSNYIKVVRETEAKLKAKNT